MQFVIDQITAFRAAMPSSGESEEPNANSSRPFLCGVVEVRSKILANLIILKGPSEGFATQIPCVSVTKYFAKHLSLYIRKAEGIKAFIHPHVH